MVTGSPVDELSSVVEGALVVVEVVDVVVEAAVVVDDAGVAAVVEAASFLLPCSVVLMAVRGELTGACSAWNDLRPKLFASWLLISLTPPRSGPLDRTETARTRVN